MKVSIKRDGAILRLTLEGRLDTMTAPELEAILKQELDGAAELHMDFKELEYLSSAGLRVILAAQKQMNRQGRMILHHVNDVIMEIFDITGFLEILTIENETYA